MTETRDIIDAIDELVDWQMSQHANRSGYDFNVNQVDCPHAWCDSTWHGLAITRRMRGMRAAGQVDPGYTYADDESETICPGSAFTGEFTPPASPNTGYDSGWMNGADVLDAYLAAYRATTASLLGVPDFTERVNAVLYPSLATVENAQHGVLDMAEVDSLRNLRCQAGTQDAAHAEYLREHVMYSFAEEVARRYPGIQLDSTEIRTEHRQDGISRLVAWWEPNPVGGILEGGHAHGRRVDEPTYGDRVETVAPVRVSLADFRTELDTQVSLNMVTYERAGYDTVARRWVYKPRQPARPTPAVRPRSASRHLVIAPNRAEAWRYAATHGLNPVIVTRPDECRGLDPTQFVIHDLGCDPRLRAELRHRAGIAGVTLESLIHTPGAQAA